MFVPPGFIYVTKIIVKMWIPINSIGKISNNLYKRSEVQSPPRSKTN